MYQIMIVDDDPTSLAIAKALLEPSYKIILMKSGVQALGYLKNNPMPDVILLDMVMPGTSGIDVLKTLKEDSGLCKIPVIFLTSMEDSNLQIEGFLMGAIDFISKPVNPTMLKRKIEYQVEQIRLRQENQEMRIRIAQLERVVRQCGTLLKAVMPNE